MTTTIDSLMARAASQIGTMERTGNNDVLYADYWGITGYSWCYAFVQWCFDTDNARLPYITMYVPAGVAWCRNNFENIERGQAPQRGDIVHFTWSMAEWPPDRPGTGDHVGLVEDWNGLDTLTTIEGNVGTPQGVYRMKRSINASVINYWRPRVYTDGTIIPPQPPQQEDDEDMGIQIMSDPAQGGDGSVYGVWGYEAWAFSDDAIRQAMESLGVLKPGIARVHPATVNGFVYRGVIEADQYTLKTGPMPSNADLGGAVNAVGQQVRVSEEAIRANSNAAARAVMDNSNKLAASIPGGSTPTPGIDVATALKSASVSQLLAEIDSRVKAS